MSAMIEIQKDTIYITSLLTQFMGEEVVPYAGSNARLIYNGNKYAKTIGGVKKWWGGLDVDLCGRFVKDVKLPFSTDFRYLIPIIEHIEEMGYAVLIVRGTYKVYALSDENNPIVHIVCGDLSKKTEMTCELLVRFVEWVNEKDERTFESPRVVS